jgi:hypothetical protein
MKGEEIIELELSIEELVDVALETNYAQDFDLIVEIDLVDVDDVTPPPTIKLGDVERHASLLFGVLLENSLYFGVHETISSQKLVTNLDKMTIANLGRQH